ncbi:hypothetical protein BDP27DRAFT_1399770 [Rhodocollybia butyracea]|uniref:Uncharacterized protein n=1 Tax=Rhodocollybia butyracea TaxID=206335 RepID=A0A9P5Q4Z9_9AGAR|nr:hypothetical protein BDP27DRAFT_1399770 [Rhodocollybia butyracea]
MNPQPASGKHHVKRDKLLDAIETLSEGVRWTLWGIGEESLRQTGKTNIFAKRVQDYSKVGVGHSGDSGTTQVSRTCLFRHEAARALHLFPGCETVRYQSPGHSEIAEAHHC